MIVIKQVARLGNVKSGRGAELWVEYDTVGTYTVVDEFTGLAKILPKRELLRWFIKSPFDVVKLETDRRRGTLRGRLSDELSIAGKDLRVDDFKILTKEYTLGRTEKDALILASENTRGASKGDAFPLQYGLGWERIDKEPESPTLTQEKIGINTSGNASLDVVFDSTPREGFTCR